MTDKITLIEAEIAKQSKRVTEANRIAERTELAASQERERLGQLEEELADELKWRRYNPEVF